MVGLTSRCGRPDKADVVCLIRLGAIQRGVLLDICQDRCYIEGTEWSCLVDDSKQAGDGLCKAFCFRKPFLWKDAYP